MFYYTIRNEFSRGFWKQIPSANTLTRAKYIVTKQFKEGEPGDMIIIGKLTDTGIKEIAQREVTVNLPIKWQVLE